MTFYAFPIAALQDSRKDVGYISSLRMVACSFFFCCGGGCYKKDESLHLGSCQWIMYCSFGNISPFSK